MTPTDAQKRDGLRHVHYEIYSLAGQSWLTGRPVADNLENTTHIRNALLEGSLVHCRILVDFFGNNPRSRHNEDDIQSGDYGYNEPPVLVDKALLTKLNKTIAHLTYYRTGLSEEERRWTGQRIISPVLVLCHAFIDYLLDRTSYLPPGPPADPANPQAWETREGWVALRDWIIFMLAQEGTWICLGASGVPASPSSTSTPLIVRGGSWPAS